MNRLCQLIWCENYDGGVSFALQRALSGRLYHYLLTAHSAYAKHHRALHLLCKAHCRLKYPQHLKTSESGTADEGMRTGQQFPSIPGCIMRTFYKLALFLIKWISDVSAFLIPIHRNFKSAAILTPPNAFDYRVQGLLTTTLAKEEGQKGNIQVKLYHCQLNMSNKISYRCLKPHKCALSMF